MTETQLWKNLRPHLNQRGLFQKTSDRFTPGVPDVLGMADSVGYALELKQLKGVHTLKCHFRPGQLDWLRDWEAAGGRSWVVATRGALLLAFPWDYGPLLERGEPPGYVYENAAMCWERKRGESWATGVDMLLSVTK